MRVTIRSDENGTYVSYAEVRDVGLFALILEAKKVNFKRLCIEGDEVDVTTAKSREAVELFDEMMVTEQKENEK